MNRTLAVCLKVCLVWCLLLIVAVANGALREQWLQPRLGYSIALPLSGVSLALLIFLVAWLCVPWFGRQRAPTFLCAGILWLVLTLCFEGLFGHYARGESWSALLRVFDLSEGNLFVLALLSNLVSPWLAARLRGMI